MNKISILLHDDFTIVKSTPLLCGYAIPYEEKCKSYKLQKQADFMR